MDLVDLYDKASAWTQRNIAGATDLSAGTPCTEWDVKTVINHCVDVNRFFAANVKGEEYALDTTKPRDVIGDDPAADYEQSRQAVLDAFRGADAKQHAMIMSIAVGDQLIHGWDIAKATGQDTTMPDGLADTVFGNMYGNLPPDRRGNSFKPEVELPDDASAQDKLIAYSGRQP